MSSILIPRNCVVEKKIPSVRQASLVFITLEDRWILLGQNKDGSEIGPGSINGPGGKRELGETMCECAVRETKEEFGITIFSQFLTEVGIFTFCASGVPYMEVTVFRTNTFSGQPRETESMIPIVHPLDNLPFDQMLEGDRYWIPRALRETNLRARVLYREKAKGFRGIIWYPHKPSPSSSPP